MSNIIDIIAIINVILNKKLKFLPKWSERRDSNPQHSAWEADALPLSHSRVLLFTLYNHIFSFVKYLCIEFLRTVNFSTSLPLIQIIII